MKDKEFELTGEWHVSNVTSRPIDANFHQVDYSTHHWGSLEMMKDYFRVTPFDKDYVLMMIENTIKNGYKLTNEVQQLDNMLNRIK
jgi:hypothetical protein